MGHYFTFLLVAFFAASSALAQDGTRIRQETGGTTVIGPRNVPLHLGAEALMAGDNEEGIRQTLRGLQIAHGRREEEAALSNLCAGYIKIGDYKEALRYCDILLTRNDKNWRGYNNRAVVHIMMKNYELAAADRSRSGRSCPVSPAGSPRPRRWPSRAGLPARSAPRGEFERG